MWVWPASSVRRTAIKTDDTLQEGLTAAERERERDS